MTKEVGTYQLIAEFINFSIDCFKSRPIVSIVNGLIFCGVVNLLMMAIGLTIYTDISMPIAGIAILVLGPVLAMNLYVEASKRNQELKGYEKDDRIISESISSVLFVSFCLLVIMLLFIMFIPSIYAISTNVIGGGIDIMSMVDEIYENNMMLFATVIWSLFMGWGAFSISWFSYPMIVSNRISGATAIIYSIKMSYNHFPLMVAWGTIVMLTVVASLLSPYFVGFIITIPLLAYATFDCNRILSREIKEIGTDDLKYQEKLDEFCK